MLELCNIKSWINSRATTQQFSVVSVHNLSGIVSHFTTHLDPYCDLMSTEFCY